MNSLGILILMILVNLPILLFALRGKHLTVPYGLIAAAIMGATLFLAHWALWLALTVFFATSSLLTKYKASSQEKIIVKEVFDKGGERDTWQVFANGGIPLIVSFYILAVTHRFWALQVTSPLLLYAFSALAVVTADTWATEIGVLSKHLPRYVLRPWQHVKRGSSGGITLQGTLAGITGAFLISLVPAITLFPYDMPCAAYTIFIITLSGFLGNTLDSIIGASIQAMYYCDTCQVITEKRVHTCSTKTRKIRGLSIINNDVVNYLAAAIGSLIVFIPPRFL